MFAGGSAQVATYGPDFLIDLDNIVVTFEYRNGIFGFLNLGFGDYTGNMGLKDQLLAMKWVHENIENFLGNKDEVLLFGVSTGNKWFHLTVSISDISFSVRWCVCELAYAERRV